MKLQLQVSVLQVIFSLTTYHLKIWEILFHNLRLGIQILTQTRERTIYLNGVRLSVKQDSGHNKTADLRIYNIFYQCWDKSFFKSSILRCYSSRIYTISKTSTSIYWCVRNNDSIIFFNKIQKRSSFNYDRIFNFIVRCQFLCLVLQPSLWRDLLF